MRERLLQEQKSRTDLVSRLRGVVSRKAISTRLGSEMFERQRDLTALTIVQRELEDIEAALRRIELGTYGNCEECGNLIGDERLEARPWVRMCLVHQSQIERPRSR